MNMSDNPKIGLGGSADDPWPVQGAEVLCSPSESSHPQADCRLHTGEVGMKTL